MILHDAVSTDWLNGALDGIRLARDLRSAAVGDRQIADDSPHELSKKLSVALYEVLHAGIGERAAAPPLPRRDSACDRALARAVPHREVSVRVRVLTGDVVPAAEAAPAGLAGTPRGPDGADGERLLVEREGVRVWVPCTALAGGPASWRPGAVVRMRATSRRPMLSPGFFFVEGTRRPHPGDPGLRIYVHLEDFDSATAVWEAVLADLEAAGAAYRAKVISTRTGYPRFDALVLYLGRDSWHLHPRIARLAGDMPGVGAATSVFARRLRPGVALAWEPSDPRTGMRGLSFGQHRASAVAHGLVRSVREGTPAGQAVREALLEANIDPDRPARNCDSPDPAARGE